MMATIEALLTRIEKRLAIAAGLNVQIHAEDQMLEMLRHKYNTLFDDHWWFDYLTLETFTLNGTTGLVTADLSSKIRRFTDINGVFLNGNSNKLPLLSPGVNPLLFNSEAISPYPIDPTKVFKVWPVDRAGSVYVWYRTRIADDEWDIELAPTTNINMDDELLILGTCYDYLVDSGDNDEAASKYETQYNARYEQLVTLGFQNGISKARQSTGMPTQWSIDG